MEQFLAQVPQAPGLPPSLFSEFDGSERVPEPEDTSVSAEVVEDVAPAPSLSPVSKAPVTQTYFTLTSSFGSGARARTPPRPRLERSVVLRGELTVPRADYSETYTVWWVHTSHTDYDVINSLHKVLASDYIVVRSSDLGTNNYP